MSDGVLIIGAGGHASVLLDILIEQEINILGYISPLPANNKNLFSGYKWFKNNSDILQFDNAKIELVNGIGSLPRKYLRSDIYGQYKKLGYSFATIVSKKACVSSYAFLEEGVQIMHGVVVQAGTNIGYNSIVNTGSTVDHDCSIGSNNHIAPGVTISGEVTSKENVHFGTGSSVIQSIRINENVVVGAGATIVKDVEKHTICYPAYSLKKIYN
tara:strand:- start:382 stop:1023 length:642 start_codon:yes stop_codon:yes gene_type:complete